MVNVECVADFDEQPDLNLTFFYNGAPQSINIKLPISINKFIEPTEMNGEAFFSRWKNLSLPAQESQKIFKAAHPMENADATKTKLIGYGFQVPQLYIFSYFTMIFFAAVGKYRPQS